MDIEVGNYRIRTVPLNYVLEEKYEVVKKEGGVDVPTGEFSYRFIGYYGNVVPAFRKMLDCDFKGSMSDSDRSIVETIQRHQKELETLYERLVGVVRGDSN